MRAAGGAVRVTREVMGMPFTVDVRGCPAAASGPAVEEVFAGLVHADEVFSPFKAGSAVSRVNRGELGLLEVDPEVRGVLDLCGDFEEETGGCFSAWIGGRLDPSGLVKGWALARASRALERRGCRDHLVDGAGDVVVRGHPEPGRAWRVGVRHPVERDRVVRVVEAVDLAVATSGTYERGAHVLDPRTGQPARNDLLSVTVTGPDIVAADVYATAILVMGRDGLTWALGRPGYEAYVIDASLRATWTPGFPGG